MLLTGEQVAAVSIGEADPRRLGYFAEPRKRSVERSFTTGFPGLLRLAHLHSEQHGEGRRTGRIWIVGEGCDQNRSQRRKERGEHEPPENFGEERSHDASSSAEAQN